VAELRHKFDAPGHVSAAVNQVAQENQGIGRLFARQHRQQTLKLRATAMNVSDNKSFHAVSRPAICRNNLSVCLESGYCPTERAVARS
jgi:hypothetical protein